MSDSDQAEGGAENVKTERGAMSSSERESEIARALLALDLNTLTPVEALMKLSELRRLAEAEKPKGIRAIKTA